MYTIYYSQRYTPAIGKRYPRGHNILEGRMKGEEGDCHAPYGKGHSGGNKSMGKRGMRG